MTMTWTCQDTEDRLLDALEGTLPPADEAQWSAHAAACARCSELAAEVSGMVKSLGQMERVEPSPWLINRIILQTSGPRRERRRLAWFDFLFHPRFALGVAAVFITLTILVHTFASGPGGPSAINPVEVYRQVDRRAHLAYARGVKFFSDLRVVYEIQSRFQPQKGAKGAPSSNKKSSDQIQQLFYNRLESRLCAPGAKSPTARVPAGLLSRKPAHPNSGRSS